MGGPKEKRLLASTDLRTRPGQWVASQPEIGLCLLNLQMAQAALSLLRVFASSEKCLEIMAAHPGMANSLSSVISSVRAPHEVRLQGARMS